MDIEGNEIIKRTVPVGFEGAELAPGSSGPTEDAPAEESQDPGELDYEVDK